MEKKNVFTKILAVIGTVLVCFPILLPILFALIRFFQSGRFMFDYFMPAELFPLELVGGLLLLWASLRERAWRKLIIWSFVAAVVLLFGGQGIAIVTGLASGESEPVGWAMALTLGGIIGYILALIALGVGGALLIRDLFTASNLPAVRD